MTDETILSGLSSFHASRNFIPTSAGSTVDLIAGAETSSDKWKVTQVGDHIGFTTDSSGRRRLSFSQGGIYQITMAFLTSPTFVDVGWDTAHIDVPGYLPTVDFTISDFMSKDWPSVNLAAYVQDAGGVCSVSMYRSWTSGRNEALNSPWSTGLQIDIVELVPMDGFASSGAPATPDIGTLSASSRNAVMRFT